MNPFGALEPEELTAVAFLPAPLPQLLAGGLSHLQLLGPQGCGKTTALTSLLAHFRQQGRRTAYEYIPAGQTHFETDLADLDIFILDEAQRLRRRPQRQWLAAATAVTLIFSSHQDLTPTFTRRSLLLQTIHIDETISVETYQVWLDKRLAAFALPGVPRLTLTEGAVAWLYHRFGYDMREAEYFMYEVFQQDWQQDQIGVVDLERISGG